MNTMVRISLAWPDPLFAQGRYRLQYKRPARIGSGTVHYGGSIGRAMRRSLCAMRRLQCAVRRSLCDDPYALCDH